MTDSELVDISNSDVVYKYKVAGGIANQVMKEVRDLAVNGSCTFDLCLFGDQKMNEMISKVFNNKKKPISKGIAFPTCVNPNNVSSHLSPISKEDQNNFELKDGDVVNIMLGVQIDGYPSILAETLIVGSSEGNPVDGIKANLINALWKCNEAALRSIDKDTTNFDIAQIIKETALEYGVFPIDNMVSYLQGQNCLYGSKKIVLNPSKETISQIPVSRFEKFEVYGLDILLSTANPTKNPVPVYKTSLFKLKENKFSLRMKSSLSTYSELKKKSSPFFPYNIRDNDDPKKSRSGMIEPVTHDIVMPYIVHSEKPGVYTAQIFTTFGLLRHGIERFTAPKIDLSASKSDVVVKNQNVLNALMKPLKIGKIKKNQ